MNRTIRFAYGTLGIAVATSLLLPMGSLAQEASQPDILDRLERLEQRQVETDRQLQLRDARISELESELERLREPGSAARTGDAVEKPLKEAVEATPDVVPSAFAPESLRAGFGGFNVADSTYGNLNVSLYTYARYLNQKALDDTYTDSFGRTRQLDLRNDIQLTKAIVYFKGWVLNPALRYLAYVWSSNTSQGQGAQVVVAGSMSYRFDEAFTLGGGIGALPGTRSLEGAWPRLLKVDSRTIADDYFRGSYTSGIWGEGKLGDIFQYKAMIGNNLSQLGVDATQLDNTLDTVSLALWCMPSTGEFGPNGGFGDFEHHEELATRLGVHYTHSTEDRQSQPGKDDPENTQVRVSDGTAIFDIGAFAPDTQIDRARYQMVSLDAGLKYRGFALEGEYFVRWVDDIESRSAVPVRDPANPGQTELQPAGPVPVSDLFDHGFQLQASYMLIPKTLQIYPAGSMIFGEYGDPWDLTLGLNWYPFQTEGFERQFRINAEAIYLQDSPTGNNSVPYIVGGNGTVFTLAAELLF